MRLDIVARIEMKWLEDNFNYIDNSAGAVERQQYTRVFILKLIKGLLMPNKSQHLMHESHQVMRQFVSKQNISRSPQELNELDKTDLRGRKGNQ
ncbi:hypothetical protein Godav_000740 [Gossypium davidsonii]|uniref:Uncharacterized protein n=1 Tax=Gossypium davidsonii TaxID=34287 RepID=A0A7J8T2B8_GOSDV|nr:hypothetical protein [Gossypium davidsonii]